MDAAPVEGYVAGQPPKERYPRAEGEGKSNHDDDRAEEDEELA